MKREKLKRNYDVLNCVRLWEIYCIFLIEEFYLHVFLNKDNQTHVSRFIYVLMNLPSV